MKLDKIYYYADRVHALQAARLCGASLEKEGNYYLVAKTVHLMSGGEVKLHFGCDDHTRRILEDMQ